MTTEELKENYQKREKKRKAKKIAIAIFPISLIVLVLIILIISIIPDPSCFDNKQNGIETGIDCGGSCISCEEKYVIPLNIISATVLAEAKDFSGVVAKIENRNVDQGARFKYRMFLKDEFGQNIISFDGNSFIYPASTKYIIHPKLSFKQEEINRVEVEVLKEEWFTSSLSPAKIFSVAEAKLTEIKDASRQGYLEVRGKIVNQSARLFPSVDLVMLLYSRTGKVLSAIQTKIFDVEEAEIQDFQYTWLNYFPDLSQVDLNRIEIYPDALVD